eukprot:CAMPEP_0119553442 /NCGR_PEP_ID=MMETSP1352-20130426/6200_1 /TAXON_ID=265584 /ORGANISM="Stauroneis constricta, Strain CCMP1120" /LENGTH=343 /DNA_ID=CAMNT_0007599861 /DNA_START=176 /DNA_END=1203 /DNA_ORIENTATION=+
MTARTASSSSSSELPKHASISPTVVHSLLLFLLAGNIAPSSALIASGDSLHPTAPEIMARQSITIVNPLDTRATEALPASFVESWPTWVLLEDGNEGSFMKIPDSNGFVNPSSIDELWQPIDLNYPELRMAVGLHVRNGEVRHIMPAVDLSFMNGQHRNRGMCTVPRAHGWVTYMRGMESWVVRMYSLPAKANEETGWKQFATSVPISASVEKGLQALAQTPPDELGNGSHIIHIPLVQQRSDGTDSATTAFLPCPKVGQQLKATLGGAQNELEAAAAPGILQVMVSATIAGSESEYLPEAYKPLYSEIAFRRQAYAKFQERQQKKRDAMKQESMQRKATAAS